MLAVLLAAGRGRRLGGPKALMDLGGTTFVERAARALTAGGADTLRVVVADADQAGRVTDLLPAARVLVNPEAARRGQTSSLRRGLVDGPGRHEAFLVHTVDHPLVDASHVACLLDAWRTRPAGTLVVAPVWDGRRGHPTVFHASLADEFLALDDDEPGHRVVRRDPGRVHHVDLGTPWVVQDIDTPEDLERARRTL